MPGTLRCVAALLAALSFTAITRADDTSDIKANAKAFINAAEQEDVAKMNDMVTTYSRPIIAGLVSVIHANKILDAAAQAKYQQKISDGQFTGNEAAALDDAEVTINKNSATIVTKTAQGKRKPIVLKREGVWKVELLPGDQNAEAIQKSFAAFATAATETASEINDGKYPNAREAKAAYRRKIVEGLDKAGLLPHRGS